MLKKIMHYLFEKSDDNNMDDWTLRDELRILPGRILRMQIKIPPIDWVLDRIFVAKELRALGATHWDRPTKKTELWGLDYTVAWKIYPLLVRFSKMEKHGCPVDFFDNTASSRDEDPCTAWDKIIEEMLYGLQWIIDDNCYLTPFSEKTFEEHRDAATRAQAGLEAFGKHLTGLWD